MKEPWDMTAMYQLRDIFTRNTTASLKNDDAEIRLPEFASSYQFDQHPSLLSLYEKYTGTHLGGEPGVKAMESLYGSTSSPSRKANMFDWKSRVYRTVLGVERPGAAACAFSKWKVFYDKFDAGTTVAQLEAERVAHFGNVPEKFEHLQWLQTKFTKEKPGYAARKERGEKGARSKKKAKGESGGVVQEGGGDAQEGGGDEHDGEEDGNMNNLD